LEEEDELFESMINTITARHGQVRSESSVREVLQLFTEEVATFTDPLVENGEEDSTTADDLEDLYVGEGSR
jgi:hypothetical protein